MIVSLPPHVNIFQIKFMGVINIIIIIIINNNIVASII